MCFSCGDGGHRINRCPQVNADFPFLPAGWSMNMDNGQYRATIMNQTLAEEPGNEQRSEREGQPLGPPEIKAPLTQAVVSAKISNGNPIGGCRRKIVSPPTPVLRNLDRGMRPAKNFQSIPQKDSNTQTRGVQKTIMTPLSALAENFIPRKTSRNTSLQGHLLVCQLPCQLQFNMALLKTLTTHMSGDHSNSIPFAVIHK